MYGLHRIGGVYSGADILGVFEVGGQGRPLAAPGLDHHGVLVTPLGFQFIKRRFSGVERGGLVYALQVGHEGFLVFRCHVLHGVADLMDDAVLDLGVGVQAFNGLGETLETIDTGDQDVFDTAVMQVCEHTQPVMSAFLIRQVQAQ